MWGIDPSESGQHWSWFQEHLINAFPAIGSPGLAIISNRKKGLENAVEEHFPLAHHSHCCFFLANNVQTPYGQACCKLFWKAVYATTVSAFHDAPKEIGEENAVCKPYHDAVPPYRWAVYASLLVGIAISPPTWSRR